jgi:hypothetical protein
MSEKIYVLMRKLNGLKNASMIQKATQAEEVLDFAFAVLEDQERRIEKLERELLAVNRG